MLRSPVGANLTEGKFAPPIVRHEQKATAPGRPSREGRLFYLNAKEAQHASFRSDWGFVCRPALACP